MSLDQVRQALESVGGGIHLLIVDYLQLVTAPKEIRDRRLQVEHVSQGLKSLAMSSQVPVLCLSSLSRPPTGTNPEPTLASLRESGELEHDADIVMFLHRKDDATTLCIVAKNRDGATGVTSLVFKPEFVSFHEYAGEA
jgi:replicative DNA helicase